jgi:type IV fimbrial biogenesis protein FimT
MQFIGITKNKQAGFTLMEVMVTLAIVGVLAAIAIPSYFAWLPKKRLRASTRDLYSDMQKAKLVAIKRNSNVAITFTVASCGALPPSSIPNPAGGYVVFVDDGQGGGTPNDNILNGNEPTLLSRSMLPGVALCSAAFGGTSLASFNSRGLPKNPGSVQLFNTKKKQTITITNAGAIRSQ